MTLSLGIDIGTSGVRTAVLQADGALVSMVRVDHLPQEADRIDAEKWWSAVQTCIARHLADLAGRGLSGHDISRIAVDGTSGTMVLTDAALRPVTRALMYNSAGFHREADRIGQVAPEAHITRGGNSALGRAMRLVEEAEDGAEDGAGGAPARFLLHQADFIAAKLLGQGGLSDHNNALKTGFDPAVERWPDWIGEVIDPALLPAPVPPGASFGPVSGAVADDLGLSRRAVICAGTTDSIAAFLAAAPLRPGIAVTSLGSTLAVKALSRDRVDDPAVGLYSHRLGEVWLAGGASNTGGAVLAHFFPAERLAELSAQMTPDAPTGLDYYPLLAPGERFPVNDTGLQPRLQPRPTSDAAFLQGMFEGIARIEAQCYREIAARGGRFPEKVYSAGGGAQNPAFTRIRARALGIVPQTAQADEAAIGVARLAAGHVAEGAASTL